MAQLFINVIGHNGSGKTTLSKKLADQFAFNLVNGDDFRHFIYDHIRYFNDLDGSFPSDRFSQLAPLVLDYRVKLTHTLLANQQTVIYDGSGATRAYRDNYLPAIRQEFPDVKTVIIWVDIDEKELLARLAERDKAQKARWTKQYHQIKKALFDPPKDDEANVILRYDQTNYNEIAETIKKSSEVTKI
ncbi:ATP-binding protein [Candidatus Saccharibacteria bacterium]|nr:ATP-binding protein [Candidatus Saccharibacteria bacterium]